MENNTQEAMSFCKNYSENEMACDFAEDKQKLK